MAVAGKGGKLGQELGLAMSFLRPILAPALIASRSFTMSPAEPCRALGAGA